MDEKTDQEKDRASYIEVYLSMAFIFSERSHDSQTKHGCVITDPQDRIISCGCNGFPRGCKDDLLPTKRPITDQEAKDPFSNKYLWMLHSERNALANCNVRPPQGSKAYVTGQCCNPCLHAMWQEGVTEIYMARGRGYTAHDEIQQKVFDIFVEQSDIKIYYIEVEKLPTMIDLSGVKKYEPRSS